MRITLIFIVQSSILLVCFSCQRLKKEQEVPPKVMAVFPSSDTLPENLLRMYIHFSKPMKTVGNLENIKLLDSEGKEVDGAIFNNVYELWDKTQKNLTIIFDPARVKTGLKANAQMGSALQVGKHYTLRIGQLEDVYSNPLASTFTKSFFVNEADKIAPKIENWKVIIPKINSKTPLIIEFPSMLDHLSLLQRLQLTDSKNQPIDGQVEIKNQETTWHFNPTKKWLAGDYILYVHARLEDPAGNNLNGLFDHKIGTLKYAQEEEIEQLNFKIR